MSNEIDIKTNNLLQKKLNAKYLVLTPEINLSIEKTTKIPLSKITETVFENIKMTEVLTPLVVNMFYYCDPDGHTEYVYSKEKLPIDDRTPYLGKFTFKDIECSDVNVAAGTFYGLPEQPIESIDIENVSFKYAKNPVSGRPAMMDGLDPMSGKGLIFDYVNNVNIVNVTFEGLKDKEIETFDVASITRK